MDPTLNDIKSLMMALRSRFPQAKRASNEELQHFCREAFYQDKYQDLRWLEKELSRTFPAVESVPVYTVSDQPLVPIESTPSRTLTQIETHAFQNQIHDSPYPKAPKLMQTASEKTRQVPITVPRAGAELAGPVSFGPLTGEDPLKELKPSEPKSIENQEQLDAVIARHETWRQNVLGAKLELPSGRANLAGADLHGLSLAFKDLSLAVLRGANLDHCDLRGAKLWGADLREASLRGADLSRAVLRRAKLKGSILESAIIEGCDWREADLPEGWVPVSDSSN